MIRLAKGYKRAIDETRGRKAKNGFSGQKRVFGPKKNHPLLRGHHVPATTGQSCGECGKYAFLPKNHFPAERKNGRISVIPVRTRSIVIVGSKKCLDDLEQSKKCPIILKMSPVDLESVLTI